MLPRTVANVFCTWFSVRLTAAPAGVPQVTPLSPERSTIRFRLFTAHPLPAARKTSVISPCMVCWRNDQVAPASLEVRMKPPPPTSITVVALVRWIPPTSDFERILRSTGVQFTPPSVLVSAVANLPVAHRTGSTAPMVVASTARRSRVVPDATGVQFAPPSTVRRMVPPSPTTHPIEESMNLTALRRTAVPLVCGVQFTPPSVVARIVPEAPTIQPSVALRS